jgi:hypothetical protein
MTNPLRRTLASLLACSAAALAGCGGSGTAVTSMAPSETQITEGGFHFVLPAGPDGKPDGWTLSSQGNTVSAKHAGGKSIEIKGNQLSVDGKSAGTLDGGDSIHVKSDGKIVINGLRVIE